MTRYLIKKTNDITLPILRNIIKNQNNKTEFGETRFEDFHFKISSNKIEKHCST